MIYSEQGKILKRLLEDYSDWELNTGNYCLYNVKYKFMLCLSDKYKLLCIYYGNPCRNRLDLNWFDKVILTYKISKYRKYLKKIEENNIKEKFIKSIEDIDNKSLFLL